MHARLNISKADGFNAPPEPLMQNRGTAVSDEAGWSATSNETRRTFAASSIRDTLNPIQYQSFESSPIYDVLIN